MCYVWLPLNATLIRCQAQAAMSMNVANAVASGMPIALSLCVLKAKLAYPLAPPSLALLAWNEARAHPFRPSSVPSVIGSGRSWVIMFVCLVERKL